MSRCPLCEAPQRPRRVAKEETRSVSGNAGASSQSSTLRTIRIALRSRRFRGGSLPGVHVADGSDRAAEQAAGCDGGQSRDTGPGKGRYSAHRPPSLTLLDCARQLGDAARPPSLIGKASPVEGFGKGPRRARPCRPYAMLPMIFLISSREKARSVSVRTLPNEPSFSSVAVIASSLPSVTSTRS
jgi:hypothetical protein